MASLRVPTIQHLARNWRDKPDAVKRELIRVAKHPPNFGYSALYGALDDMLLFKQPYDEIVKGIEKKVSRKGVRENFLEVLPLMQSHFDGIQPEFVQEVGRSYYAAGKGLLIPFEPRFIYGVGGQIYFDWFSFWRSNPLSGKKLSLFVTVVEEMLLQTPDLENAKFRIIDFSKPRMDRPRELKVIDTATVPRLDHSQKTDMLDVYAEGFFNAKAELAAMPIQPKKKSEEKPDVPDPNQPFLF